MNVPPMDTDLATVDTSMPLLADGTYDMKVEKAEIKPTSKGGSMIHLELSTTQPATGRTGQTLNAGVRVFTNVNTVPSGKATWDQVKQSLGQLVQAAAFPPGVAKLDNVPVWTPMLIGKVLPTKVIFRPARVDGASGKQYKESNEVAYFLKRT